MGDGLDDELLSDEVLDDMLDHDGWGEVLDDKLDHDELGEVLDDELLWGDDVLLVLLGSNYKVWWVFLALDSCKVQLWEYHDDLSLDIWV